jgi:hypothetical protein
MSSISSWIGPRGSLCRNRHCPKCQTLDKERWLEAQAEALLPVPYFHVVCTLPQELGPLALRNPQVVYALLFQAASETLLELSRDPRHLGAQIGVKNGSTGIVRWSCRGQYG